MVVFALLTLGTVLAAVVTGLRILKKEYLPLLSALCRSRLWRGEDDSDGEGEAP